MMAIILCGLQAASQVPPISAPLRAPVAVTSYPAIFFAPSRPNTAFDMIVRLPGFTFDAGQTVRGFGGAAGNVLIDGQRPSSKADSLEDLLKRIASSDVERIDLIRGGAPGIDMQGRTVVANIVLKKSARTEVTGTAVVNAYSDRRVAPTIQVDASHRRGERVISGSVRYYQEEGGEQGTGSYQVRTPDNALVRNAAARKKDIDKGLELRASAQRRLLGGLTHLNLSLDRTGTDQAEQYFFRSPPDTGLVESTFDRFRRTSAEIGGDYTRDLDARTQLKLVALKSFRDRTYDSRSDQGQVVSDFAQESRSGETIFRLSATRTWSAKVSLEAGAERVFNFLDGRSSLTLDGMPIELPNAQVRVEEKRSEVFATLNWQLAASLSLEAGARVETSTLSQSGDSDKAVSFLFPKPRTVLTWSPNPDSQIRLRLEREVGQLDFADFVASANLATGVVSAGNANLEPEQRWILEATFERRFWGSADLVLTMRHVALQKVIDQSPVEGFNAPGNIGGGRRDVALVDLTLPLAKLGLRGGLLKANAQWLSSRVIDPTTGRARLISGDQPFSGSIVVTNDMPRLKSTWTISVDGGYREKSYLIDEVQTLRRAASLDLAWEYKPTSDLAFLVQLTNITQHGRERRRDLYDGLRSTRALASFETFRVDVPAALYVRVRKSL